MSKKKVSVEIKKLNLIPCKTEGVCQECATEHEEWEPHNLCLYYQYHFYDQHQRFPTWLDAMAHCSETVKSNTLKVLKEHGILIEKHKVKKKVKK